MLSWNDTPEAHSVNTEERRGEEEEEQTREPLKPSFNWTVILSFSFATFSFSIAPAVAPLTFVILIRLSACSVVIATLITFVHYLTVCPPCFCLYISPVVRPPAVVVVHQPTVLDNYASKCWCTAKTAASGNIDCL